MKRIALFSLTLIALAPVLTLLAGSSSDTSEVRFEIVGSQSFSLRTAPIQFSSPSDTDLQRGLVDYREAAVLSMSANHNWVAQLRTTSTYMGTSRDSSFQKPVSDFRVRSGGVSFESVSVSERIISSGNSGGYEIPVDYRVLFDADSHRDGQYSITLIYTITTR